MIFEKRYSQCEECNLRSMCKFKEDYYKNKGGIDWKDELYKNGESVCKHAKSQGLVK